MNKKMTRQLGVGAVVIPVKIRNTTKDLMFHSDRGSQYAIHDFQNALLKHGIKASISRKKDC